MMKISQSSIRMSVVGVLVLLVLVVPTGPVAFAQALPAAEASPISTGFALPRTEGTLTYAVSASENLIWGYYGNSGSASSTALTGDLAYLSSGKRHPFSAIISGGYAWGESGQSSYGFVNLSASQVANIGRWNFVLSDNVYYLPGTPTAGLSGVPGVGDLGVNPVPVAGDLGQGVLTNFSNRVSNTVVGNVARQLTGKTSIGASGSYLTTRFLTNSGGSANTSGPGLDSDGWSASANMNHQIDPRTSYGAGYSYTSYSYPGQSLVGNTSGFVSQTITGSYSHQFTRKVGLGVSAGPQWTTLNNFSGSSGLSVFADVSGTYTGKSFVSSLTYTRTTNNGYGVTGGAISDSVVLSANRKFAEVWNGAVFTGYTRTASLPVANVTPYSFNTVVAGVQVSRAIARSFSAYASYTLEHQTSSSSVRTVDLFSGFSHVLGFGVTYSPGSIHFGRQ